jgi:uncharacterized protein YjbI with pentapeptide repeats
MLILVEPYFVVDDEDFFDLNQIGNADEIKPTILFYLKQLYPVQEIKKLSKTNYYTIETLPTETIDNMVNDWLEGYITKLTTSMNDVKIMVGSQTYSAKLKFHVFRNMNFEDFSDSEIKDKIDEFKQHGVQLNDFTELPNELNGLALNLALLPGGNFENSFIQYASFLRAKIPASNFTNANLLGTSFYNADLRYADFTNAIVTNKLMLGEDNLLTANFERANLRHANFANTVLENVVFREADLSDAIMTNANLNEASLNGAVLNNADLRGAILTRTTINDAELTGVQLMGANLERGMLMRSFLNNANLTRANLTDIILTNADLTDANLTDADLTDADFRYARLDGTIFTGCTLTRTRFYGSTWENAIFDQGENVLDYAILEAGPDDQEEQEEWENEQAVAFEIHNAYDKIKMDKYMEILDKLVDDSLINVYKTDIIEFVRNALTERINVLFANKAEMIEMLNAILDKLRPTELIQNESVRIQIGKTISYVLTLPLSLQTSYINYLVRGCYFAYPDLPPGEGLSCVKGIPERIIYLIGETIMLIPTESRSINEKELLNLFHTYLDINNNDFIEAWVESWKTRDEEWSKLNSDERKLDFIEFVIQKYRENSADFDDNEENIRQLVGDKANEFNYVFSNMEESNITFGGKKRKTRKITKRVKNTKKLLLKKVGQNPKKTKKLLLKKVGQKTKKTKKLLLKKVGQKTKKNYKNY